MLKYAAEKVEARCESGLAPIWQWGRQPTTRSDENLSSRDAFASASCLAAFMIIAAEMQNTMDQATSRALLPTIGRPLFGLTLSRGQGDDHVTRGVTRKGCPPMGKAEHVGRASRNAKANTSVSADLREQEPSSAELRRIGQIARQRAESGSISASNWLARRALRTEKPFCHAENPRTRP